MSDDINLARLENYIAAQREGLQKILEGTFGGILARIHEDFGPTLPTVPEVLRWEYTVAREHWLAVWEGYTHTVGVCVPHGVPVPTAGDYVALFIEGAPNSHPPMTLTVSLVLRVRGVALLTFAPRLGTRHEGR